MENISKNITYNEATKSPTAIRYKVDNNPNEQQLSNMKELAENVFEPLRELLGNKPIKIDSFFRSKNLNDLVGGAINSQHMALKGAAIDIDNDDVEPTNIQIFNCIKDNIEFDQLIAEGMSDDNEIPQWIHVSFNKGKNRKEILLMSGGKYYKYDKEKWLNIKNYKS